MFAFLLGLQIASADVVNMPPEDCPPGAIGTSSHAGEWCKPNYCQSDTDCSDGNSCLEVPICVSRTEEPCGGIGADSGCTFTKTKVHDVCLESEACTTGECETAMVCAKLEDLSGSAGISDGSGDSGAPDKEEGSCGNCAAVSFDTGVGILLLIAVVIAWRRRE